MKQSRISGLYKLSVSERIDQLLDGGWISEGSARSLRQGGQTLKSRDADKMIENVVGVFGLPLAIAPNFIVNGREHLVPLVVEEPSIVAALSKSAADARPSGGFSVDSDVSRLIGQIHLLDVPDSSVAEAAIQGAHAELLAAANAVHPRLTKRGGGVDAISLRTIKIADGSPVLVVHLHVNTCDAMGANLVNTICEAMAPKFAALSGGNVLLKILTNLADESLFTARARYTLDVLQTEDMDGASVRDRIVACNDIAIADRYRAATHNKGIMNGIDPVAVATGNDWRAIEAGAHAFAAREGRYQSLTHWSVADDGALEGTLTIPLKVATVGGALATNPGTTLALEIASVATAAELAELMAAVGLAQNYAALRALASSGIQAGHMRLHARGLAAAAGAADHNIDTVVDALMDSGDVKAWKAREIVQSLAENPTACDHPHTGAGKILLFGEHAVVYGRHALALPIPNAMSAVATQAQQQSTLSVPSWNLQKTIDVEGRDGIDGMINTILGELGIADQSVAFSVNARIPYGKGLGSSAAIAVACTRAAAACFDVSIDDERVNDIAFTCEKIAHGTPSGVDNTIAVVADPILFRRARDLKFERIDVGRQVPLVLAFSSTVGKTRELVSAVRQRYENSRSRFERLFDAIDSISIEGKDALKRHDYDALGAMMNESQGLLNAIGVSTADLECIIEVARDAGAVGAKLTGAGGGGAVVALCPGCEDDVANALQRAGYEALRVSEIYGD